MNDNKIIENIFVDIACKFCQLIGWRESIGQIYALLYVNDTPFTLDDMAQHTGLSKSNVCEVIQKLSGLGAVNKVLITKRRKDYYVAEKNLELLFFRGILPLLQRKSGFLTSSLENAEQKLVEAEQENEFNDVAALSKYKNNLKEIIALKNKLDTFLKMIESVK